MTYDDALAELTLRCPPDAVPTLTEEQVEMIVLRARRPDAAGRPITDPDWDGTYDLAWAAQAAWEAKAAAAVACGVDMTADGLTVRQSQMVAHCREQAQYWRRKRVQTVTVTSSRGGRCG